jgi:hypothetical protein
MKILVSGARGTNGGACSAAPLSSAALHAALQLTGL